jgi:HAMP domain-containing protein
MGRSKLQRLMQRLEANQAESQALDVAINEIDALINKLRKQADSLIVAMSEQDN